MFPKSLISLVGCYLNWPARSSDLTSGDFLLRGNLKAGIFKHDPQNFRPLYEKISSYSILTYWEEICRTGEFLQRIVYGNRFVIWTVRSLKKFYLAAFLLSLAPHPVYLASNGKNPKYSKT